MKQEDKELLLKDLCARLPYGVIVREDTILYDDKNTTSCRVKKLSYVQIGKGFSRIKGFIHDYEYIYIPYLFPMSSMTEEQHKEFYNIFPNSMSFSYTTRNELVIYTDPEYDCDHAFESFVEMQDWLNAHFFDYRGLIEKGLAIDATGLNIY